MPDWQPRVLLGMVEARSVNVKKTTTIFRNLIVVVFNLLFLVLGLSLALYFYFDVPFFGFVTTEIRFVALKNKKEKVLDRGQNGF